MQIFDRQGKPISDWRNWTRPKSEKGHWKASRSAMELARAWFTSPVPVTPPEISALLQSHELTRNTILSAGWPESVTSLPMPGEGRNHDLLMIGKANGKDVLLAIEGKVDETMGPAVGKYWRKSKKTSRSRGWRRVDSLLKSAFGGTAVATAKPWSELPYQMLTAIVGTALEADKRNCALGVLCIHEHLTESAKPRSVERNERQFQAFLNALGQRSVAAGQLYGPFDINVGDPTKNVSVLVGKATYDWSAR